MKNPFGWLLNLFRRGDDPVRQVRYVLPYPVSGLQLTPDETLSLSAVWACIDVIARALASCLWNVYVPTGANRRQLLYEDPLAHVLNSRPNPEMTAIGFREALLFQAIPFGNAYAEIVKDGAGRVAQLWPLATDRVTPRRDDKWNLVYEYRQPDGELVYLPASKVFHLRGPGLYGLMGENVIARAAKSIAVAAAQERFTASFFGQGAQPGGVLKVPGVISPERHQLLKNDWAEKRKGPENAHKPLILEAGWEFEATSIDPEKSQLTEGRQFSVEEICRWFGVPPHKVQHLLRATFSNIEHSSLEFVRDALTPWARRLEQEADYKLFRQDRAPWKYTCIEMGPLSMGDMKSRFEAYAQARQNGVMSANEIRAREGLDDLGPDGDVLLVQQNMTTVENLLNPPEPPPAPKPKLPAPNGDDPAGSGDDEAGLVARDALIVIMAGALERYAKRLASRRADLERGGKKSPTEVAAHMERERAQQWERLVAELGPTAPIAARALGRELSPDDLRKAAELVAGGEQPRTASLKALPAHCPRAA